MGRRKQYQSPPADQPRPAFPHFIGSTASTVRRMEAGHPGTAIALIARTLQVFGELDKLNQLLDTPNDAVGLTLMDQRLPQRVRKPRQTPESGGF